MYKPYFAASFVTTIVVAERGSRYTNNDFQKPERGRKTPLRFYTRNNIGVKLISFGADE